MKNGPQWAVLLFRALDNSVSVYHIKIAQTLPYAKPVITTLRIIAKRFSFDKLKLLCLLSNLANVRLNSTVCRVERMTRVDVFAAAIDIEIFPFHFAAPSFVDRNDSIDRY
jgi:hypothetical protein